ncbi:MAG: InlB B-repeat-containing protein, partial [Coriobacteriia bacterium]|nr:InlB B-repeat-containing protein [Coriobacteriia bacterium]
DGTGAPFAGHPGNLQEGDTFQVTFKVSEDDTATVTVTMLVSNRTAAVLTVPAGKIVAHNAPFPDGAFADTTPSYMQGVSVFDSEDGPALNASHITHDRPVDTKIPDSDYRVTYTVTDSDGNVTTKTGLVFVGDWIDLDGYYINAHDFRKNLSDVKGTQAEVLTESRARAIDGRPELAPNVPNENFGNPVDVIVLNDGGYYSQGSSTTLANGFQITLAIDEAKDRTHNITALVDDNRLSLSYRANGGSGTPPATTVHNPGTTTSVAAKGNLTRTGYTFEGWATSASGNVAYQPGQNIRINSNTTLFAVWKAVPIPRVTLTYHANGGTGTPPAAVQRDQGSTVTLAGQGSLRLAGHSFEGWASTPRGNAAYQPGQTVRLNANANLYAVWKAIPPAATVSLTYHANGGTGTPPASLQRTPGSTVTLAAPGNLQRSGHSFGGWALASNGGAAYQPGQNMRLHENIRLYAVWTTTPVAAPTPPPTIIVTPATPQPPNIIVQPPVYIPGQPVYVPVAGAPVVIREPAEPAPAEPRTPVTRTTTIQPDPVPMAEVPAQVETWALINLIATLLLMLALLAAIVRFMRRPDPEEDDDYERSRKSKDDGKHSAPSRLFMAVSAVAAIAALVLFVITQNLGSIMTMMDKYTTIFVVLCIVGLISTVALFVSAALSNNKSKEEDAEYEYEVGRSSTVSMVD